MKILNSSRKSRFSTFSKTMLGLSALAAAGLLVQTARASVAAPYKVSEMVGFQTGRLGDVGTQLEGWSGGAPDYVTVTNGSGSLDGTGLGLAASAGDKAYINPGPQEQNPLWQFATSRAFPATSPATTNVYWSFLYKFNSTSSISNNVDQRFMRMILANSSSSEFWSLYATNLTGGKFHVGIMKPGAANVSPYYSPVDVTFGNVFFVVVKENLLAGGANDEVDLWVNPATNGFMVGEGSLPTPDVSTIDGNEPTSATGPGRLYLTSGLDAECDEFRFSTNWADVTPLVGTCFGAAILANPAASVTNVEGMAATLSVGASGTLATYQWQYSTDSGAHFSNVTDGVGATTPTYRTRNMQLGDNGIQYRCVVNTTCGGGATATSAAGTVSVTPCTFTANGVIMNDTWATGDRITLPITSTHSVWYASSSDSLSASAGEMDGTPQTTASRVWEGYFKDDTNNPVCLDVGKALKATLVFSASGIVTNSGGFRLGLYDCAYPDGGIRLTNDNFGNGKGGKNLTGYMLSINYGTNFSDGTPFNLYARANVSDDNLMGNLPDFTSIGSGPPGMSNAPAFKNDTTYTLELTVRRVLTNLVKVTSVCSGGGSRWETTGTDTNSSYAYHRFDTYGIRANSLESTANSFKFTQFKVEVLNATPTTRPPLDIQMITNRIVLDWTNSVFGLQAAPHVEGVYTNIPGAVSGYDIGHGEAERYFRLSYY